jgi:histidine triad (HIT) family protein
MAYDSSNIFAKILSGDIPCKKVYEDVFALAFHDIAPAAPVHVLVVPKGDYESFTDFASKAGTRNVGQFFESVQRVIATLGLKDFRIITNNGTGAGQTVAHFHVHILAGREMGPLLAE